MRSSACLRFIPRPESRFPSPRPEGPPGKSQTSQTDVCATREGIGDLGGDVSNWTHPAGFTITHQTNAAQEITQITSSLADSTHPQYLVTNATYTPFGTLATLTNGCYGTGQNQGCTEAQETYDYNSRLQPVRIQLGTSATPNASYCLVYNYYVGVNNPTSCSTPATATSGNNGNLMGYFDQDTADAALGHTASYTYDTLNRLASAVASGSSTYNLTFAYDVFGNMTCQTNSKTQGLCTNVAFDPTTNRINTSGYRVANRTRATVET